MDDGYWTSRNHQFWPILNATHQASSGGCLRVYALHGYPGRPSHVKPVPEGGTPRTNPRARYRRLRERCHRRAISPPAALEASSPCAPHAGEPYIGCSSESFPYICALWHRSADHPTSIGEPWSLRSPLRRSVPSAGLRRRRSGSGGGAGACRPVRRRCPSWATCICSRRRFPSSSKIAYALFLLARRSDRPTHRLAEWAREYGDIYSVRISALLGSRCVLSSAT
jgi:hypothetical protein